MKQTKFFNEGERFRWWMPAGERWHKHKWVYKVTEKRDTQYMTGHGSFSHSGIGLLYMAPPKISASLRTDL